METAVSDHITVSDDEWSMIAPLLPAEHGRNCRPSPDNRRFFEGMIWIASKGATWRDLPEFYGKWNSVFRRYRRWIDNSVFDLLLLTLAEVAIPDLATNALDSSAVRAHALAAIIKTELDRPRRRNGPAEPKLFIEEIVPRSAFEASPTARASRSLRAGMQQTMPSGG